MKIYILLQGNMPWESCAANPFHLLSLPGNSKHIPRNQVLCSSQLCAASQEGKRKGKEGMCYFTEEGMCFESHGVTEAGRTSEHHPVQPVLKAGSATAVSQVQIAARMESPHPLWAASVIFQKLSFKKKRGSYV